MIPVETTTASWKWQMDAIPVVDITDSAPEQKSVN
jgi:electron transport complex protein RnfB